MRAAIGFRAHTGWAAAVALAGPVASPTAVDRRRVDLLEPDVPWEAFHAAGKLAPAAAEALIRRAVESAEARAGSALRLAIDELRRAGHKIVATGIVLASGRPPVTLEEALSSHPMKHAAEGQLYRGALIHASGALGLRVAAIAERDLYRRATAETGLPDYRLRERVSELGRAWGPPWGQDQKSAALAAWIALATRARGQRRST